MATASHVQVSTTEKPVFYVPDLTESSAARTSDLLQENHDKHHIFFNQSGFHNHIAHHLCTLYALKASPEIIEKQYDLNKTYQRSPVPLDKDVTGSFHEKEHYKEHLGDERYYHDYLQFFQQEIEAKGWKDVVNEYLFAGDERADDMLVRVFSGFLHPIIHLGFGVEFDQPAIIAEALAQAAVHSNWIGNMFLPAEQRARSSSQPVPSIVALLDETRTKLSLRAAAAATNNNRIRDGLLKHDAETMIEIVSKYRLEESDLERATAEMTNAAAYFTGAAQRPTKQVKMDFYYMHCINCSIFFSAFLKADWLSTHNKVRLLEWKVRNDITMYASRGSPDLLIDEVIKYEPKQSTFTATGDPWQELFDRVCTFEDDGHGSKLIRALAHGQKICEPYEDLDQFRIKHDMWLQLGHMAIDSVEAPDGIHWIRSTGFDSAWNDVPDRARL